MSTPNLKMFSPRTSIRKHLKSTPSVGVIGIGCVGGAVYRYFKDKAKTSG